MPRRAETRIALVTGASGFIAATLDADGAVTDTVRLSSDEVAAWVAARERDSSPRWVFRSSRTVYARLLDLGIRVERAHDLTLCHAILRDSSLLSHPLAPDPAWSGAAAADTPPTLFDAFAPASSDEAELTAVVAQHREQLIALETAPDGRLALLCAAESAGGLIAEEMRAAGVPWDVRTHDRLLVAALGERGPGGVPQRMAATAEEVRAALGDRTVNLDSPPKLLRALHRAGVLVESTSRWELAQHEHPAVAPLLAYKKMARLLSANGWSWLQEWVHDNRFRPVYIPGGVVTGRWASSGGGALQLPRSLRPAVRSDEGWMLVVADVAQLEPRMLAAMSQDEAMARAARGRDLYAGVVESGAVATRQEAKYAVLGAMYGATSGEGGRLVPRLRKVYPRAMRAVDEAARVGEQGGRVSTRLGRTSPPPDDGWWGAQSAAAADGAGPAASRSSQRMARERGRFTRNFIVQGTAAEWSLIWLAEIRHRLAALPRTAHPAPASALFSREAHLAFFLHDEVIVHTPQEHAEAAAQAVVEAAETATRRLFGEFPIDVPLDLRITRTAEK